MGRPVKYWVLRDGKNYLVRWTGIGPAATQNKKKALRFATLQEAIKHPASNFTLTAYDPVAVF